MIQYPKQECLCRIRSRYARMTPVEKRIADYVLGNENVIYRSITELIRASRAGYGSVVRFCQRLGYEGFQDFKIHLAEDLGGRRVGAEATVGQGLVAETSAAAIADLQRTVQLLSNEQLEGAANSLAGTKSVLVAGCGGSAIIAQEIEYRLTRFAVPAVAIADGHMQAIRAATLTTKDVAFLVSFTGSTRDILKTGRIAQQAGSKIIALTNYAESPLGELAAFKLLTGVEIDPLGAEVVSKVPSDFVLDCLFRRLRQILPKAEETLRKTYRAVSDRQL